MEAIGQFNEQQIVSGSSQVVPQLSVGGWILTFVLLAIPLVNIIMLFIWAFDATSARRNFARAQLIIYIILLVLSVGLGILFYILGATSGLFS